jgi:predicted nuclease with TOPRIM domain
LKDTALIKQLSETREELSQAQDEISNTNDEALETNNLLTDRINKRSEVIKQLREHNATLKTNLEEPKSNTRVYTMVDKQCSIIQFTVIQFFDLCYNNE